ncbi:MAG: response regulator [candidate division Zixibacteria bacterium]|nr:response regulator [candidate division Zixibacteria bacterium]
MSKKINILVVDDEQIILDSIVKLLRHDDYNVITVLSVNDAFEEIKKTDIGIILTDLMMPEIDGLEFMQIVKKDNPKIPVIMITGYATINTALQATQLGAFDYIAKPFSKKEFLAVIKRATELVLGYDEITDSSDGHTTLITDTIKAIGDNSWMMLEKSGCLRLGVERSFLRPIGKIQSIYLPAIGDQLRQGGNYLQIFSTDMRAHTIMSPFSGTVKEVNKKVLDDPNSALQDPYGDGWLICLTPSSFEAERKLLGL